MANLTSEFLASPHYKTMCVTLAAQSAASDTPIKRGSIVAIKATDDGSYNLLASSTYTKPFGVLVDDVAKVTSAQAVTVLVSGELNKEFMTDIYKAQLSASSMPQTFVNEMRNLGILIK